MPSAVAPTFLDLSTLAFVAVGLADLLGLFLVFCWLQERAVRALAWWGSAYFIGAFSLTLWLTPIAQQLPSEIPEALTLLACGVVWSGIRLFHGRRIQPMSAFAGAVLWPLLCQLAALAPGTKTRLALGAVVVAIYTFAVAREFWRERRKSLMSRRTGVLVPILHATVFLSAPAMQLIAPEQGQSVWQTLFLIQIMIYSTGAAFLLLLAVKDQRVDMYRHAANTDPLTGVMNRRAFNEHALALGAQRGLRGKPVTVMMFDLDHFKSINDRFGHATGDAVLRTFAQVLRTSMRANDIVARLGGEEFAAIVPGDLSVAALIGERVRAAYQAAGAVVEGYAIKGTVSIGAASAVAPVMNLEALIERADEALYRAKHEGRNRVCMAEAAPTAEIVPLTPKRTQFAA
jgi:diguanylate cyclase (GGDEF)-like protein